MKTICFPEFLISFFQAFVKSLIVRFEKYMPCYKKNIFFPFECLTVRKGKKSRKRNPKKASIIAIVKSLLNSNVLRVFQKIGR